MFKNIFNLGYFHEHQTMQVCKFVFWFASLISIIHLSAAFWRVVNKLKIVTTLALHDKYIQFRITSCKLWESISNNPANLRSFQSYFFPSVKSQMCEQWFHIIVHKHVNQSRAPCATLSIHEPSNLILQFASRARILIQVSSSPHSLSQVCVWRDFRSISILAVRNKSKIISELYVRHLKLFIVCFKSPKTFWHKQKNIQTG